MRLRLLLCLAALLVAGAAPMAIPPLHGALLKNEQDVMLFEKLAFMARRNG